MGLLREPGLRHAVVLENDDLQLPAAGDRWRGSCVFLFGRRREKHAGGLRKVDAFPARDGRECPEGVRVDRFGDDGQAAIDVTFRLGTDIDQAQVLTQNRVAVALAKLPEGAKQPRQSADDY